MNFVSKLVNHFKAGYPCIAILTGEENRAQSDVMAAAKTLGRAVVTWSAGEGIVMLDTAQRIPDTENLGAALFTLRADKQEKVVYILRDIHQSPLTSDPILARLLREMITDAPTRFCSVVLIAPAFTPYDSIEQLVTVMEYSLPSPTDLKEMAKNIAESAPKKVKKATDAVIKALSGLSTTEAENALALSVIETGEFSPEVIYREKVTAVKRSGLLEIIEPNPAGLDSVGGLGNLKSWILKRKKAYSAEAEKYGLPTPKGVLIIGVSGTGKSLTAKAVGTALGIPTLKLDIGALFNSLVGESEARTRAALQLAEAISPCALWLDECDKGLAGISGSGSNDSGVTKRVFGTLLQWMQDNQKPVFLVATANQVEYLPPEFLRKGRFDEMFTVDLPTQSEREQVAAVVIKKLKRDPKNFDLSKIAAATQNFTGAEIEAVVSESLFAAFDDNAREITTADVVSAASNIIPIAKTMSEKIEAIRRWGEGRARPAAAPQQQTQSTTRKLTV